MADDVGAAIGTARAWLVQHPEDARDEDVGVRATLGPGLSVELSDDHGATVSTDMPTALGGRGHDFTPGTLMRAAIASCNTTMIAMIAAERGLELDRVEVRVESISDNRGMLGSTDVPSGPLELRVHYLVTGPDLGDDVVREIVAETEERSPLMDTLKRSVPVSYEVLSTT